MYIFTHITQWYTIVKVMHACTCAPAVQCCFVTILHCTMLVGTSRHGIAVEEWVVRPGWQYVQAWYSPQELVRLLVVDTS